MNLLTPDQQAACDAVSEALWVPGAERVDPPIALPADIAIDLAGESVRSRLCTFTGADGREMALRPDLTLPIALARAEMTTAAPASLAYCGRAFRLPPVPGAPLEFVQLGVERFGHAPSPVEDAFVLADMVEALEAAGLKDMTVFTGDVALFSECVAGMDLPAPWKDKLQRRFRDASRLSHLLESSHASGAAPSGLGGLLEARSEALTPAALEEALALSDTPTMGAREADEIVEGLRRRAAQRALGPLPEAASATLQALLAVKGDPADAISQLVRIDGLTSPEARAAIDRLDKRFDELARRLGSRMQSVHFATPFGRRFNYYSGFVFEIIAPPLSAAEPVASGGRYDNLVGILRRHLARGEAALGAQVRPDRLARALEATA